MCIRLLRSIIKKHQNLSTKKHLLSHQTCLLHRKQPRMRQSHKLQNLRQRLPRHLEHWVLMAIPRRLQSTDCTAPGLGRTILVTTLMRHMVVPTLLYLSPANSPLSHCHQTSAMYEIPVSISHLPLRCNMATAPLIYLRPLAQRPLDPFRHIQQLLPVCRSTLHRPINSQLLDLDFHGPRPHRHRVLHLARAIELSASLQRYRAHLSQLHRKRIVRRRSPREHSTEALHHPQGCQNVAMRCNQGYLRPLLEQRNGTNGVDQEFLR
jgi:hypothetical protein